MFQRFGGAVGLAVLILLSGCSNGQSVLAGFDDHPTQIALAIADDRPVTDKKSEILSLSVASCDYGIRRLGDETTVPQRLNLLRHDLEERLGEQLHDKTVHVTRYTMYWNPRIAVLSSWMFASGTSLEGGPPKLLDTMTLGQTCTKEEMGESWIEPSKDLIGKTPLVVIVEAAIGDKSYKLHSSYVPEHPVRITEPSPEMFAALRKANADLAEQIRGN